MSYNKDNLKYIKYIKYTLRDFYLHNATTSIQGIS